MSSEVDPKALDAAIEAWPKPWEPYNLGLSMRKCIEAYLHVSASPSIGRVGQMIVPRPIDLPMEHWKGWDLCAQAYILAFREANREATAATLVYHEEPAGDTQGAVPVVDEKHAVGEVDFDALPLLVRIQSVLGDPVVDIEHHLRDVEGLLNEARDALAALVSPPDNGEPGNG